MRRIPFVPEPEVPAAGPLAAELRRDPARWAAAVAAVAAIAPAADWLAVLEALGHEVERRPDGTGRMRLRGGQVAALRTAAEPAQLARLEPEGRPLAGVILHDCAREGARFGLLASGGRLRLFDGAPAAGSAATCRLDLDRRRLAAADRPLLALLAPPYLAEGGLDDLWLAAANRRAGARRELDEAIRGAVLPALGRALGGWAGGHGLDPGSEVVRAELERAALVLLLRLLFLLHAESSNRALAGGAAGGPTLSVLVRASTGDRVGPPPTGLWRRFTRLVRAVREGGPAWCLPASGGALFAPDRLHGASLLERAVIADADFAGVLAGLAGPARGGSRIDHSLLAAEDLGRIHEGLLALRLTRAGPAPGDLLWMADEGGRKSGGAYYTRPELVRHLVRQAVTPAFERHLAEVRRLGERDLALAGRRLLDFAVVDPACGSGHFLVEALDHLLDMVVRFLAVTPLPAFAEEVGRLRASLRVRSEPGPDVDDVALVRRLVLERCIHGVELSPLAAEAARVSLRAAAPVPGLDPAGLDDNVRAGNSLVGVARPESVGGAAPGALAGGSPPLVRPATADLERVFDLWTAEAFGVLGARGEVELRGADLLRGAGSRLDAAARAAARRHAFLHWPLAFPAVFSRARPGFDAVVGNPPWDEVTVETLAFLARFSPGLRRLPEADRERVVAGLLGDRPELGDRLNGERERARRERAHLAAGDFEPAPGDPDVYKLFCQRYRTLVRDGGRLAVVLPRGALLAEGSARFRAWLFGELTCDRVDFLVNRGRWAFDAEPRYTIALVAAGHGRPPPGHRVRVLGTASSAAEWAAQAVAEGVPVEPAAFGAGLRVPLLRDRREAELLARLRAGTPFPLGAGGRWRCFPVAELHETADRAHWRGMTGGAPLWKGESFDQFCPHGARSRSCPATGPVLRRLRKPRPGADSLLAAETDLVRRREAVVRELGRARVAYRDVSRATDSRTVRACLVPPGVLLTNTAPYLAFLDGGPAAQAACLGLMNSLPFDWQARRFVESHVSFFLLEGLRLPSLPDGDLEEVALAAARLSCPDERFADFAAALGIAARPLPGEERERLRVEIDARCCRAWGLDGGDLDVVLADFSPAAVPAGYRRRLASRLAELGLVSSR